LLGQPKYREREEGKGKVLDMYTKIHMHLKKEKGFLKSKSV
jgi:hypothetical protein